MLLPLLFSNIFLILTISLLSTLEFVISKFSWDCLNASVHELIVQRWSRIFSVWRFHHLAEAGSCLVQCFTCFRFLWSEWSGADMLNMLNTLPGEPLLPSVINNDDESWSVITTWSRLQCQHSNMLKHLQCPASSVLCPLSQFVLQLILWPVLRELRRRYLPPPHYSNTNNSINCCVNWLL